MNQDNSLSSEIRGRLLGEIVHEIRMQQNVTDVFDDVISERLGLNRTDLRCLDILERTQPAPAGRLALESGLSTGAVTAVLDRLERAGYARRIRDTQDRRRVLVEVVPEKMAPMLALYAPLADRMVAELGEASDDQLIFLRDFLRSGREFLLDYTERLRNESDRTAATERPPA